jgi:hypothetical protein
MAEIKFSLHLVSDAEPGSGFGSELINSLVPRNLEGKPIIPASHIKGLMRDHLEKIANDLGKNDLKRLVSQCFGEEGNSDSTSAMTISISDLLPEGKNFRNAAPLPILRFEPVKQSPPVRFLPARYGLPDNRRLHRIFFYALDYYQSTQSEEDGIEGAANALSKSPGMKVECRALP